MNFLFNLFELIKYSVKHVILVIAGIIVGRILVG